MNKKLVFGLSATFFVAGAFWACGSGDVIEYDGNLEGLAELSAEGIGGKEIQEAMALCLQDATCSAEMQSAPDLQPESSADVQSSASTPKSSTGLSWATQSSATQQPASSMVIVQRSSSSTYVVASGTSTAVQSSSSAVITTPGGDVGTCEPAKATINRGESTAWKMTKNATLSAAAVLGADFTWTFGEDASPNTSSKHGNMSSDAITYATSGVKTATLDFVYNGSKTTMQCAPLQVNGAAITGCKCTYAAEQVDVAVDGTAAWTVTGCTSQGANITTYTWGGDGVTGDGTAATAVLTEKGQNVTPTLLVGNDDNTQQAVTCPMVSAIDGRVPDYEFKASGNTNAITFKGDVDATVVFNLPSGWHGGDSECNFACQVTRGQGGNGAISGTLGTMKIAGNDYVKITMPVSSTTGGTALPFKVTVSPNEAIICSVEW
jgi:hypothetical protein